MNFDSKCQGLFLNDKMGEIAVKTRKMNFISAMMTILLSQFRKLSSISQDPADPKTHFEVFTYLSSTEHASGVEDFR
jgi:hypothetical protein